MASWTTPAAVRPPVPSGLPTVTVGNPLGLRADPSTVDTVMRLAARQHSLLSRRQWLDGGLSQRQLDRAVANGAVLIIHPGVYAVRGAKASFERDVLAACLATGGVASHRCAAYLWKCRKFERPVVEVLVTKGHAPALPGIAVRRTGRLEGVESTHVGPIPITTTARTLLDLVSVAPALVEGALDGLLHRRRVSLRSLGQTLERAGECHPGHRALAPLVAARAAGRRPTESELEDDLLALIRRFGLPEPVPQYPYRGRRIDFAYPDLVVGIEANGVQAHAAREDVQRNAEKANDLLEWWMLYFTYDDVHGTPAAVARRIEDAIRRRRLAPQVQPAA
jgi:very-short-patch-repair endonuclease